ncbi:MAG: YbgC/FadM family acyl-CoA thioesterase [Burkholderiaceae bacterium]
MTRQHFRFFERLRVRWAEVDMQKIVFNGHYLLYFDTAVGGYWRALALPYEAAMHQLGGDLYVKKASLEYHASARYDDTLEVAIKCEHMGNSSMRFASAVFRGETLLVSGELLYVFADPSTQKSQPVPAVLREVLLGFEAGQQMVEVRLGSWDALGHDAAALREAVFMQEQGVSPADEWDGRDPQALHAVAYNRMGLAVATARLLQETQESTGTARIGRMAVCRVLRGSGVGTRLLHSLLQTAAAQGHAQVVLHAQCSAQGFYARAGFTPRGPVFDDAGLPHVEMFMPLGGQSPEIPR